MKTKKAKRPLKLRVYEPEVHQGTNDVATIIIGSPCRSDCEREIAFVNCESLAFHGDEMVGIKSRITGQTLKVPSGAMRMAQQFAASGDMLKALEFVVDWFETWSVEIGPAEENLLGVVNSAIAKALGGRS